MIRLAFALLLVLTALPLAAQSRDVIIGLSQERVDITANFDGSEIRVFGAVKRSTPLAIGENLDVIITVSGPSMPVTVRKKDRVAGIWVNTQSVEVDQAPSFYKLVTTAPLNDILTEVEDLRHKISIPRAIRSVGAPDNVEDARNFTEALIRIRKDQGLYAVLEDSVRMLDQTLFDAEIALPANLVEGTYDARVFLVREGAVIAEYATRIDVQKVGLERAIYRLAHDQPLVYGILSLVIAIAAGWGASAIFRYVLN
ncbi:TIGR02186 family protein [Actibacterium sp. 188UL27-1]|uniref:TIGR02186 family protein n=1 Tax=Actibacterium sp. 188UL27-1 TaxID=2786961 RepID=UPI00195ED525|nr:TIGR02186 family protein [Actibacterium sp. 188UL27-1]MBM7068142.1 TIGR02186 family protein [Actibacterium sp. 188UL27-1]